MDTAEYRTLCISNLNPAVADPTVKDSLYQEFKKFGEFNIRIVHSGEMRLAYINFRYPDQAREAKHARMSMNLFDTPLRIDSVYNTQKTFVRERKYSDNGNNDFRSKYSSGRSVSPDSFKHEDSRHSGGSMPSMHRDRDSQRDNRDSMRDGPRDMRDSQRDLRDSSRDMRDGPRDMRDGPRDGYRDGMRNEPRDRDYHHSGNGFNKRGPPIDRYDNRYHQMGDDEKATRTLFIGNLDSEATEDDLRRMFDRFGDVEEVDIKKGAKGPYAFVKFFNLDMAVKAKNSLNGHVIGRNQCRIGWGKATPTPCLWVGGLSAGVRTETLSREFDRFGPIIKIKWLEGDNFCYVLYENVDSAKTAFTALRGVLLTGADRKLRIDFADQNHMSGLPAPSRKHFDDNRSPNHGGGFSRETGHHDRNWSRGNGGGFDRSGGGRDNWRRDNRDDDFRSQNRGDRQGQFRRDDNFNRGDNYRKYDNAGGFGEAERQSRGAHRDNFQRGGAGDNRRYNNNRFDERSYDGPPQKRYRPASPVDRPGGFERNGRSFEREEPRDRGNRDTVEVQINDAQDVYELSKIVPVCWSGALVLKNSAFAARMHLISGDVGLVDNLMRDNTTTELPLLRIMQRLRLDPPKLEEVNRRLASAGYGGNCVLLAMPGSSETLEEANTNTQQRPLKNLVSYLKQKEAAGVINLPPNPTATRSTGVLYAFTPCQFGHDFLEKSAPRLHLDANKEDYMIVVVVRTEN